MIFYVLVFFIVFPQRKNTHRKTSISACFFESDSGGIQTCNLLIRSQMLYSVKLRSQILCVQRYNIFVIVQKAYRVFCTTQLKGYSVLNHSVYINRKITLQSSPDKCNGIGTKKLGQQPGTNRKPTKNLIWRERKSPQILC